MEQENTLDIMKEQIADLYKKYMVLEQAFNDLKDNHSKSSVITLGMQPAYKKYVEKEVGKVNGEN